jgi:hypothetical protein
VDLVWPRLPEGARQCRFGYLAVAAEFHREEPLEWLAREATMVEIEDTFEFALRLGLADALVLPVLL